MLTESIYNNEDAMTSMLTTSYLRSEEFNIATNSIFELLSQMNTWICNGICGAMVYGRTRAGKTSAISYITRALKAKYGEDFPIIIWSLTDHKATDKAFYASILDAIDIEIPKYNRVTALELKNKVINYLTIMACQTPFRKVIFMIDEAYKLDQKEYYWLMDLYNTLYIKHNINMITFLIGTPKEMIATRECFVAAKERQIVERFMLNEYKFYGIRNMPELCMCLAEFDKTPICGSRGVVDNITISQFFFPDAHREGKAIFYELGHDYWNAFLEIRQKYGVKEKDIPMHYFIESFINCLTCFGKTSDTPKYFLTKEEITKSIIASNYGKLADEG